MIKELIIAVLSAAAAMTGFVPTEEFHQEMAQENFVGCVEQIKEASVEQKIVDVGEVDPEEIDISGFHYGKGGYAYCGNGERLPEKPILSKDLEKKEETTEEQGEIKLTVGGGSDSANGDNMVRICLSPYPIFNGSSFTNLQLQNKNSNRYMELRIMVGGSCVYNSGRIAPGGMIDAGDASISVSSPVSALGEVHFYNANGEHCSQTNVIMELQPKQ